MRSFIPAASGPHAAVCASRVASGSEAADATALFRPPPKATVTEHSTLCDESVDQSRKAAKARSASSERTLPRAVMLSPIGLGQPVSGPTGTKLLVLLFYSQASTRRDFGKRKASWSVSKF
jgi:hypothetical protein